MHDRRFVLVALSSVICATPALANYTPQEIEEGVARCEKHPPGPQVEVNACAGLRAAKAELRLTRAYTELRALLKRTGEPGDADHLLRVQRAWIAFREVSCESRVKGTLSPLLHSGCMAAMADDRAADLEMALKDECDRSCFEGSGVMECKPCST
jgi:uncharacterized protein YecT (DUF1311 family)